MDAGYGADTGLRTAISVLGLTYVAGIQRPRRSASGRAVAEAWSGAGGRAGRAKASALEACRAEEAWQTVTWREGSADWLTSRYARVRVRAADRRDERSAAEEWLLVEWPEGEAEPTKYWLSTLPGDIAFERIWSTSPSCAGGSSATTRNSSRNSASATTRGAAGGASTTTPHCASPPTASWSPSGRRFPPQDRLPPRASRNLPFPTVTDPEVPPIRPERHIPNSIATVHRRLAVAIARTLPRCPCCASKFTRNVRRNL